MSGILSGTFPFVNLTGKTLVLIPSTCPYQRTIIEPNEVILLKNAGVEYQIQYIHSTNIITALTLQGCRRKMVDSGFAVHWREDSQERRMEIMKRKAKISYENLTQGLFD